MKKNTVILIASLAFILVATAAVLLVNREKDSFTKDDWDKATGCYQIIGEAMEAKPRKGISGVPNPSATFCLCMGGEYKVITEESGNQSGQCSYKDKVYEGWDFYRLMISVAPETISQDATPR